MPRLRFLVLIALIMIGGNLFAGGVVPPQILCAIVAKILAYDTNIAKSKEKLVIGIIAQKDNATSVLVQKAIFNEFKRRGALKIRGRKVHVVKTTDTSYPNAEADVFFFAPGTEAAVGDIVKYAQKRKILTMTSTIVHLTKGVSVGILPSKEGTQIVVNNQAATAQGASFDGRFLSIVKVIKSSK